jgi:hypothetical protein
MRSLRLHIPNRETLLERLEYLENFIKKLDDSSQVKKEVQKEIDKIQNILEGKNFF